MLHVIFLLSQILTSSEFSESIWKKVWFWQGRIYDLLEVGFSNFLQDDLFKTFYDLFLGSA